MQCRQWHGHAKTATPPPPPPPLQEKVDVYIRTSRALKTFQMARIFRRCVCVCVCVSVGVCLHICRRTLSLFRSDFCLLNFVCKIVHELSTYAQVINLCLNKATVFGFLCFIPSLKVIKSIKVASFKESFHLRISENESRRFVGKR